MGEPALKLHGPYRTDSYGAKVYGTSDKGGGPMTVLDIRGWGYLTGHGDGALALSSNEAIEEQRAFAEFVVDALNRAQAEGRDYIAARTLIARRTETGV